MQPLTPHKQTTGGQPLCLHICVHEILGQSDAATAALPTVSSLLMLLLYDWLIRLLIKPFCLLARQ